MERDVNYILIGFFVVLLSISVVFVVLWLSNTRYKEEYKFYIIKFKESVSGLNIGASVKYKGIKIGNVERLSIDKEDPTIIDVIVKIKKQVPIKEDSRAILSYQGITGLASIEIKGGSKYSKVLESKRGEKYPEIQTEPSIIKRLDTTLSILSSQAQHLVDNLNYLLSKNNVEKLMKVVNNLNMIIKNIADKNKEISNILDKLSESSSRLPDLIDLTNKNITSVSKNINILLNNITKDEKKLSSLIMDKTNRFSTNTDRVSCEIIKTLRDIQSSVQKINLFLSTIEDRPSKILYDNILLKPGPGE